MIQSHKEQVTEEKEIVDNVFCNCCGRSVHRDKDICGRDMFVDYLSFKDNRIYRQRFNDFYEDFHICEDCAKKINSTFKIPVEKVNI